MKRLIKEGSGIDRFLEKQFGGTMFSYQQIFSMLLPLIMDALFVNLINVLTTAMISSSSQESVSAVSLVGPVTLVIYAVLNAVSAGGTVVVAQYKGKGDVEDCRIAAGQLMLVTPLSALIVCSLVAIFSSQIVHMLFGAAEPLVIAKAEQYLVGCAISMIFLAFYLGVFAVLRGLGETKLCLRLSIIINVLSLVGSLIFVNWLKLDIMGSILSLNMARIIGGGIAVWTLMSKRSVLRVSLKHLFKLDLPILKEVFRIGLPFGIEQLFMSGGSMIAQTYVVLLGTVSVSANAVANSVVMLLYGGGSAVADLAVTVVGQGIGAGDKEEARRSGVRMIKLGTWMILLFLAVLLPTLPWLLKLYRAPSETLSIIYLLLYTISAFMPFFWPMSNIMPYIMRAAGDASFCSYFSMVTMWVIRVGVGYLLAISAGLSVLGVWIALGLEWAVRTVVFYFRFKSGVWLEKRTAV